MNKVKTFQFMRKLEKLIQLSDKARELEKEISSNLEEHLGEGWFIHNDPGDGWLIVDSDSNQYKSTHFEILLSLPRDEALEYIKDFIFN